MARTNLSNPLTILVAAQVAVAATAAVLVALNPLDGPTEARVLAALATTSALTAAAAGFLARSGGEPAPDEAAASQPPGPPIPPIPPIPTVPPVPAVQAVQTLPAVPPVPVAVPVTGDLPPFTAVVSPAPTADGGPSLSAAAPAVRDPRPGTGSSGAMALPPSGAVSGVSSSEAGELVKLGEAVNAMRERLEEQIRTIDRQRRNLEVLVAALEEGVIVADGDGRIVLSNPAARRMLGRESDHGPIDRWRGRLMETVVGHHDLQTMLLANPAAAAVVGGSSSSGSGVATAVNGNPGTGGGSGGAAGGATAQLVAAADRRTAGSIVEIEGLDERRLTLRARATDLVLELPGTRSSLGRLLVLSDITELTQSLRMKADFVANASHELRTPLNTMHMALENLLSMDREAESAMAERFLKMALGQCTRLEALVRDMLDLSRVESPAARFRPETVDPAAFFGDLRERFTHRLESKRLELTVDCPPEVRLRAAPHLMTLVFDNLVDNAIKFTGPGGRIAVSARVGAADLRPDGAADRPGVGGPDFSADEGTPARIDVSVADTGCGIPPADQSRVFERFYQVDRARSGPERGTGLGLSIVKHAVAAMDGVVRLDSEPGRGTTITVQLPGLTLP